MAADVPPSTQAAAAAAVQGERASVGILESVRSEVLFVLCFV